jgi:hypothetical protein
MDFLSILGIVFKVALAIGVVVAGLAMLRDMAGKFLWWRIQAQARRRWASQGLIRDPGCALTRPMTEDEKIAELSKWRNLVPALVGAGFSALNRQRPGLLTPIVTYGFSGSAPEVEDGDLGSPVT